MSISKRLKQLLALITHPLSIASKYDTPWDNVIFGEVRDMYDNNKIKHLMFEDLLDRLELKKPREDIALEHLYEGHRTSGTISPLELHVIGTLCNILKPRNILEIGTFEGRTTLNMSLVSPESTVHTICIPQEQCGFVVGKYFKERPEASNINQIFENSQTFDFSALPPMDLIFVDGDHSYEGVVKDSDSAFNIVSDNGVILFHDFDTCHLGNTKAVLDAVTRFGYEYCNIEGTSLAIAYNRKVN